MEDFQGTLICCDVDGTLTHERGQISQQNIDAIARFQQGGGLFTAATGRFPQFVEQFAPHFVPNAPIIAINGTMIYDWDNRKILYEQPLPPAARAVVEDVAARYDIDQLRIVHSIGDPTFYNKGEGKNLLEVCAAVPDPWHKLVFVMGEADCLRLKADLMARYGHLYAFDRSWANGLEMHAAGTGKGECLERLKAFVSRPIHRVVAIGDYENDISMLRAADIGYAVGNAIDGVKAVADRVTVTNTEHAIAAVIRELATEGVGR